MQALRLNRNKSHAQIDSRKPDNELERKSDVLFPLDPILEPVEYPPPPLNDTQTHQIISNFCANLKSNKIEEAGCGVCGQLVPTVQLT